MEGGEVLISATVVGLWRGLVGADGMARPPPTTLMRQPRYHDGEGGGARLYGSGASPHIREGSACVYFRGAAPRAVRSGQSDGMEHHGEGVAGECEESL